MQRQGLPESAPTLAFVIGKAVTKRTPLAGETFGERLRRLRAARGLTQLELGHTVGLSQRMVAYYEVRGGTPGPELLARMAEALGVSADALVRRDRSSRKPAVPARENLRLWRRLQRISELPPHDRKAILRLIETMADAAKRKAR